jgi:tRNA G18 (ribose-2'-O)-methylase SpoU
VHADSLEDPALRPYRTLRRPLDHRAQGIFVAEGEKVVRRLLSSPLTVLSLLGTPERLERLAADSLLERDPQPAIYTADERLFRGIIGYHLHQCIMAVGKVPVDPDLPPGHGPRLLVALDGLQHAENVGIIVRNASAFGAAGVLSSRTGCSPYLRRAVRNSMGAVFTMPVLHPPTLPGLLAMLRAGGTRVVAAHLEGGRPIGSVDLRGDCCLVFGSEDGGVSAEVLATCDDVAAIPMQRGTDSLNAANAAAVFLYEAARQREFTG